MIERGILKKVETSEKIDDSLTHVIVGSEFIDDFGHVHYKYFPDLFEAGRKDFVEKKGIDYSEIEETYGLRRFVRKMEVTYDSQIREGDKIGVHTNVEKVGNTSITFSQQIESDSQHVSQGRITLVFVNKEGIPTAIPSEVRKKLTNSSEDLQQGN